MTTHLHPTDGLPLTATPKYEAIDTFPGEVRVADVIDLCIEQETRARLAEAQLAVAVKALNLMVGAFGLPGCKKALAEIKAIGV
jgi:hypothetical protein